MTHLSDLEMQNWLSLYIAAGSCCTLALVLSIGTTIAQLYKERDWDSLKTAKGAFLFFPKTWWRWQKLYLLSAPVTLAIVGSFAASLSWR
ncbi:MAG TPA: hypothetical protein VF503_15540 [Sphingobium sp.]